MCKEEKIKQLDNKEIKCEKCTGVSKAHCFLGNIIRTRCPVCRQFYKPKNKDLIDYLRFKIIDSGYKKEESYNQNIILDTIKELEAHRINARETDDDFEELKCTSFSDRVNCIIILSDKRLCACSSDRSIKIFDIHTRKNFILDVFEKSAHSDEIRCIEEIQENILASGGKNDIKIWLIENKGIRLLKSIDNAHKNYINKIIKLDNGEFASCSDDGTIKVWSNQYIEKIKLKEHRGYKINSIYYFKDNQNNDRKTLVTLSNEDEEIKFLNIDNNYSSIKSFKTNKLINHNNCIAKIDNLIFIGEQNQIDIFQILKEDEIKLYEYIDDDLGNVLSLNEFINNGNHLLLAGSDIGFIYIFEICGDENEISIQNINILRNNPKALKGITDYSISCLTTYKRRIIASSKDNLIKMYKYWFEYISLD